MKIKIIGLAVVAAMALMAFAASSFGNAKVCSGEGATAECGGTHGKVYDGTILATLKTGTSATLTTTNSSGGTVNTVTCLTSTVHGTVVGDTGTGTIDEFTFANCSSAACPNGVTASTTASTTNTWPATATKGTAPNGTLSVEKIDGEFICGTIIGNITCRYTATKATTTVTGGTPATVTATNVALTRSSGPEATCGAKADWSGVYTITTPKSLFLT
ncbi:MAG TPA: hypothetical protein VNC16_11400 [Solirubrobacterales bacterium]|jgi:hypothetical protein|nr:hypothetical protein [Solirubrobacterales bacterium]